MSYNSAGQINALLPSEVPTGDQTLTVTKVSSGQTVSTTLSVMLGSCSFTASGSIAYNGYWNVDVESAASGYQLFWYGTHNGAVDATNVFGGATPHVASYGPFTNSGDRYTRYAVLRDNAGNAVCTTNTVDVTIQ